MTMRQATRWLAIVTLILFCSGCTALEYFDGSSEEERKLFSSSKEELRREATAAKSQYEKEKLLSAEREGTIRKLNAELSELKTDLSQKQTQLQELQESVARETARARLQDETIRDAAKKEDVSGVQAPSKSAAGELRKETREGTRIEGKERNASTIRMKVLSGNGKMTVAVRSAKKLAALGYKVAKIDLAPRANFRGFTLYYAPGYEKDAQQLRKKFSADMEIKPMTWASEFPLILVAAR